MKKLRVPEVSITELWEHFGGEVTGPDRSLNRKARCALPGHEDKNGSASVNEDEGVWYCQTCNKGGDTVQLVMEVQHSRFPDAVAFLESFASGGNRAVSREPVRSSLLPRGSRRDGRSGAWVAPWRRL